MSVTTDAFDCEFLHTNAWIESMNLCIYDGWNWMFSENIKYTEVRELLKLVHKYVL
jgi:hypothetical protein